MKQPILVLIKPDAVVRDLCGYILARLAGEGFEVVSAKMMKVDRRLAEEHYRHLKTKPFFEETVLLLMGHFHKRVKVLALVCCGEDAVRKCRKFVGATNPEDAAPTSIRGQLGRITTKGVFENAIHASSSSKEARREIQLWFKKSEIASPDIQKRIWT
jgi:nucleoside-diphosphate kinase